MTKPEARLRDYLLPDGVMVLAPRQPFKSYGLSAISSFLEFLRENPESRGPMVNAAEALALFKKPQGTAQWLNIEVHVDALDVPNSAQDKLLQLGFQLDGFVQFEPAEFTHHYTLKFKLDEQKTDRVRELIAFARDAFERAQEMFSAHPGLEGYVESEVYTHEWRSVGSSSDSRQVENIAFPLPPGSLRSRSADESKNDRGPMMSADERKKADIHIKVDRSPLADSLISLAVEAGFYLVETWSANRVLTAQLLDANSAVSTFHTLKAYLDGIAIESEMTLEFCNGMWRAPMTSGRLSRIPPICYL